MPYLTLKDVALPAEHPATRDDFVDSRTDHVYHTAGTVLSEHEVPPFIREKVAADDPHYLGLLRPIDDDEAFARRAVTTAAEGEHAIHAHRSVSPPWPDFADLRTDEILARMRDADAQMIAHVKAYEQARPVTRDQIVGFGQSDDPPALNETPDRTPPAALRWAGADLRDIKEAAALEDRVSTLESERQRFVLSSPLSGVLGTDHTEEGR